MELQERIKALLEKTKTEVGQSEAVLSGKVKLENLDDEVLGLINKTQIVKIEMPGNLSFQVPDSKQVPAFLKIVDDLMVGNNIFLIGEAGTGKTTLAEKVAKALNREIKVITCNQWTSPSRFIGGQTIDGYEQGDLIEAWANGDILILDEMPKLDPNTAGVLNDALAKSANPDAVIFDGQGKPHKKHPNFGCIATGNTTGKSTSMKYGGNNRQDASLIDRFSTSMYYIEFNIELEKSLTFSVVFEIFDNIRTELIKMESEEIVTLRTMLNANRIYFLEMQREVGKLPKNDGGKTLKDALESFFDSMEEDEAERVMDKVNIEAFYKGYKKVEQYNQDLKRIKIG